jgi:hypothetical protein
MLVELKAKAEVEAGLKATTLAIYPPEVDRPLAEGITLAGCGLPAKLYTLTLHKVVIADMAGVSPARLTDAQLTAACSTAEVEAGDIVSPAGYFLPQLITGYRITPVLGFRTLRGFDWEFLRLWPGFELPSSWSNLPCYALNRNRFFLDFMK